MKSFQALAAAVALVALPGAALAQIYVGPAGVFVGGGNGISVPSSGYGVGVGYSGYGSNYGSNGYGQQQYQQYPYNAYGYGSNGGYGYGSQSGYGYGSYGYGNGGTQYCPPNYVGCNGAGTNPYSYGNNGYGGYGYNGNGGSVYCPYNYVGCNGAGIDPYSGGGYNQYGYGDYPYSYSYPSGTYDAFGTQLCYWSDYSGNAPCGNDPQQWVMDPYSGQWY